MSKTEDFLSTTEEQSVIEAILIAEKNTSGEIRVHLEGHSDNNVYSRAQELFHLLKMDNTKDRNGVLIYVAVQDKQFAIIGDQGINKVVAIDFWDTTKKAIQHQFVRGNFSQGLIDGVTAVGQALTTYFPWQTNDTNQLPNEISKS